MATGRAIVGAVALLALLALATGCILRTGDVDPVTPTPAPAVTAVAPAPTGTGGAEEIVPTTVPTGTVTPPPTGTATAATPTETPAAIATPTATPSPAPTEGGETTVAATPAPAPVPPATGSIAELAATDPALTRFTQALRQGGSYETLNGTEIYTVFAPDDAAFDAVPPMTLSRLLFDRDALAAVANSHVVHGRWLLSDLARESSIATRAGTPLPVTVLDDGGLKVDDARVTWPDIVATNGVIHVVDRVMIPPGAL